MTVGALVGFVGVLAVTLAFADAVADAKAAVAKYAGPQTTWEGPTKGPKPEPGKKVAFLSGDEQNDISHLYGVYIKEAAQKLGSDVTIIDGKGSPTSWLAGMNQAIALEPDGIALFADAASLQIRLADLKACLKRQGVTEDIVRPGDAAMGRDGTPRPRPSTTGRPASGLNARAGFRAWRSASSARTISRSRSFLRSTPRSFTAATSISSWRTASIFRKA